MDLDKTNNEYQNSNDIHRLTYNDKEILLVGTAHISKHSAELVADVINGESPDVVCVELDEQRFESLSNQKRWENLDLKTIIKKKQLSTLIINILLSSYQKKLGICLSRFSFSTVLFRRRFSIRFILRCIVYFPNDMGGNAPTNCL